MMMETVEARYQCGRESGGVVCENIVTEAIMCEDGSLLRVWCQTCANALSGKGWVSVP